MSSRKPQEGEGQVSNPEGETEKRYRIYSVLSYIFVLIVIGLPVWWMTTRVYRAPLPIDRMSVHRLLNATQKQYGIPLSLEYDILITTVNPDPQNLKIDLDGELLDVNLLPFFNSLQPVADFVVKTQWLYMVDLGVTPKKVEEGWGIYQDQLAGVITPLETKLWSHLSPRPCVNLVLYVSRCSTTPLYIYDKMGNRNLRNALLSSGWGAVSILNPDSEACQKGVYKPKLEELMSLFVQQLQELLRIDQDIEEYHRRKVIEMIESTRRTLKSLSQLLQEISSIVISNDVAEKIEAAVSSADISETLLNRGEIIPALLAAKTAFRSAEAAFGDPSLLALLYFPDDQKYAVYIPLFLPVMIPVLMSLTTVRKWYSSGKQIKTKTE